MSIILGFDDPSKSELHFIVGPLVESGSKCFYCYKPLGWPIVMWHGGTADIFLHHDCAQDLGTLLGSDYIKAKNAWSKEIHQKAPFA